VVRPGHQGHRADSLVRVVKIEVPLAPFPTFRFRSVCAS
jgi:hypothetical protein